MTEGNSMSKSGTEPSKDQNGTANPNHQEERSAAPREGKSRNTVGLIALIAAIVGFIFACIPGALIVGWILLPIAFVLSIVGLVSSSKAKGTSIAAIIVSIVGVIVGVLVFLFAVGSAVDDALEQDSPEVAADSGDSADSEDDKGSRDNPAELGDTISGNEWDITVDGFDANATDEVLAQNEFNEAPDSGNNYAVAEVTAAYTGDDSGNPMVGLSFAYVTTDGNTLSASDTLADGPSPDIADVGDMYEDASKTFHVTFEIPEDDDGLVRVNPGMISDELFVSTS